jgi:TPR repeat protein
MKTVLTIVFCCAAFLLSGCASGISRSGYRKPSGPPPADIASRKIVIKSNVKYSPNDVVVLGSIHAYDTGFSTRCDEQYVLGIFCEEGRILGADVINITGEKEPTTWDTCYRARAQFLRFKDREMARGLASDAKYAPDLVAERAEESKELEEKELEAAGLSESAARSETMGQYGAIGGMVNGLLGGATGPDLRDLTPAEAQEVEAAGQDFGVIGGLIAYSNARKNSPVEKLRQTALKGDVAAQRSLGVDYEHGYNVYQNYQEAAKWYQLAANRGDAISQNNLGSFYQYGLGNSTNYDKAVTLYQQSAAQGFALAQSNLGYMYDYGLGVSTDKVAAVTWYRRAAEQNYSGGMLNLGMCYGGGNGVDRDLPQAYQWLSSAAMLAHAGRDTNVQWRVDMALVALKQQMTTNQIADGQKLFKAWDDNYSKNHQ